ncbi:MAG: AAA family ATPase [bacterium]
MANLDMIIIDSNSDSRDELIVLLEQFHQIDVIGEFDDLLAGYSAIIQEKPHIVFIDLSENADLSIEIIEKITLKNKNCVILVSSENVNTELVLRSMRAGAREFLTKPVMLEDLSTALKKIKMLLENHEGRTAGQIISVFSNKGGIGKTTIATNLALKISETTGERVCLVDLNLQLGDITTFLDITPSFDISYVITHISRIDEAFLLSSLEQYKNKELYILADPPNLEQAEEISSEDITSVLSMLKEMFSYVIVDTSSGFDMKTLTCLDISDIILLISMVNLPSIRNCQRCMDLFHRLEYQTNKIKLVVNRYIEDEEITIDDIEDALEHEVYWKIPNNYFAVMSAINKGIPISSIAPDSNIDLSFTELAGKITDSIMILDQPTKASNANLKLPFGLNLDTFKNFKLFNK